MGLLGEGAGRTWGVDINGGKGWAGCGGRASELDFKGTVRVGVSGGGSDRTWG